MRIEYIVALLLIFLVIFFRMEATASGAKIYNIRYDNNGEAIFNEIEVSLPPSLSAEDHAHALIVALFDKKHSSNFAPPGTQILTLIINDNHLTLNISKDILGFGETYYENCLRPQIVKTALTIPQIDTVTLLVDNEHYYRFEKGKENR